jgi:hypothetical protein
MSALSKASLEALLLLQVFVAGANSLGITSFAVPYPFVVSPTKLMYVTSTRSHITHPG